MRLSPPDVSRRYVQVGSDTTLEVTIRKFGQVVLFVTIELTGDVSRYAAVRDCRVAVLDRILSKLS